MRYAILSDIHGNLQAWNAVFTDLSSYGVDRILCLGDCVGYGPNPAEVLKNIHRHAHGILLGNHDAVVCGKMSPESFNDRAQQMIAWTQQQLGHRASEFLGTLPLMLTGEQFRCCHGGFDNPAAFDYIIDPDDAARSWDAVPEQLLFTGHSHVPEMFVVGESGTAYQLEAQDFEVEEGKRYIVNVGAVGSPRDGDMRASYVLYDEDAGVVVFRKVPFDLDAFHNAVFLAGLSPDDVPLLQNDPRRYLQDVREQLDFSPAQSKEQEVRDVLISRNVETRLRRSAFRWKGIAVSVLVLALVGIGGAFMWGHRAKPRPQVLPKIGEEIRLEEKDGANDEANLLPTFPAQLDADGTLRPWQIHFTDTRMQSVALNDGELTLSNTERPHYLRVQSPTFLITDVSLQRLVLMGESLKGDTFDGTFSLTLEIRSRETGEWKQQATAEFHKPPFGRVGWDSAKKTQTLPQYADAFRVVLSGNFIGDISVRNVRAEK